MVLSNYSTMLLRNLLLAWGIGLIAILPKHVVHGILPQGQLDITPGNGKDPYTLYASLGNFGGIPSMTATKNPRRILTFPPSNNPLLCENVTTSLTSEDKQQTMMVVPRGECTFERKAWNAQLLGANAIVIYGNLASHYTLNTTGHKSNNNNKNDDTYTTDDIIWPQEYYDYDCKKGRAEIPLPDISLNPLPYNSQQNDPILTGNTDDNLCHLYSPSSLRHCDSGRCLLTGKKVDSSASTSSSSTDATTSTTANDHSKYEVCCAWDLHIFLYSDTHLVKEIPDLNVTIPAAFITMQQGDQLLNDMRTNMNGNGATGVSGVLSTRYQPAYNISSILIWILGVIVCATAAYLSATDIHERSRRLKKRMESMAVQQGGNSQQRRHAANNNGMPQHTAPPPPDDSLELLPIHALGFVVMASSGLLILFYFKIYNVVKIMYALGCSSAVVQVIFHPLCRYIIYKWKIGKERVVWRTGTVDFGDITNVDIISCCLGYSMGLLWLYTAFFVPHADTVPYFWITQDIFGACMCIVFLGLIKLNSIRVASILLIVAFVYDIFFVFITPLLFHGKSVMITVATSGGPPKADPLWCEKYPDDADCQGGDPLPMLLTMPRIGDYAGGASLLGLGDIVLPGLLLSFAARLDAAKSLVGIVSGRGNNNGAVMSSHTCPDGANRCRLVGWCCSGGYFPPLIVAYAIGLLMANVAVYLMEMGQPALLYLVPCTLGTMTFMGWRRNELRGLWDGPRLIATADQIVYGRSTSTTNESGPTAAGADQGNGGSRGPQQEDDGTGEHGNDEEEAGDVPLLSPNPLN